MKALAVIAGVLQRDAAAKGDALNGRPYFRIFIGLIAELAPANPSALPALGPALPSSSALLFDGTLRCSCALVAGHTWSCGAVTACPEHVETVWVHVERVRGA